MCATFQFRGKTYKPGSEVTGSGERGIVRNAWAGFARSEILSWWQRRGAVLIDIPADRFAERSEVTGKLIWDSVEEGLVIRGLVDIQTKQPLIKVVTRASAPGGTRPLPAPPHAAAGGAPVCATAAGGEGR
ncbi:MAG: hypothetical protein WCO94_14145 [Verrucomicrobiota bacterium]